MEFEILDTNYREDQLPSYPTCKKNHLFFHWQIDIGHLKTTDLSEVHPYKKTCTAVEEGNAKGLEFICHKSVGSFQSLMVGA